MTVASSPSSSTSEHLQDQSPAQSPAQSSEKSSEQTRLQALRQSFAEKKKKLWGNLLEFGVGVLLLVVCINYLRAHPAEKASIYSGFEVLIQKVEVFMYDLFHQSGAELREKYDLERTFQELLTLVEDRQCGSLEDAQQLQERIAELKAMDLEEFARRKNLYLSFARTMYAKITEVCTDVSM